MKNGFKYLPLFLFCLFVTLGNLSSNKLLLLISSSFLLIQMILNKNDADNFYLSLFLIPCIRIFDNIGFTFLVNVFLAIPLFIYLIKHKRVNLFALASTSFLLFFEGLHTAILGNVENIPSTLSCFLVMFYCLTITTEQTSIFSLKKIWLFFCFGIVFSAMSYFVCNYQEFTSIAYRMFNNYRFVAYAGDPNYFSLYICLAMSLFFVFSKHKLYHYLLLLSLIFIGFLTASKMCIILMGLVLTIGILYGLLNTNNKQRRWSSIMLFIFMITGFLIFKELIFVFLNNFLKRLGDPSDLNSITTGRYGILKNYFSIYFSNPLTLIFGSGNQYHHYLGEVSGSVAHNTYFDVILSWGAIGLFAFTYIVYKWVKKLPRINNKSWIRWLPLITILINFLDLSCLSASMFWLVFSVPILALRTKNEEVLIDNQDIFKKTNAFYKKSAYGINDYA